MQLHQLISECNYVNGDAIAKMKNEMLISANANTFLIF